MAMPTRNHIIQLVYFGPQGSGKTSNLRRLWARLPDRFRSRLLIVDNVTDDELFAHETDLAGTTHFFDLLPLVLDMGSERLTLRIVAVPGHSMHQSTRRLLLRNADGVVFVADSGLSFAENAQCFLELRASLRENGLAPDSMPLVLQLNKIDREPLLTTEAQLRQLVQGRADVATVLASADKDRGVAETLVELIRLVWPTVLHERNAFAMVGLDGAQLAQLLLQRLGVARVDADGARP